MFFCLIDIGEKQSVKYYGFATKSLKEPLDYHSLLYRSLLKVLISII